MSKKIRKSFALTLIVLAVMLLCQQFSVFAQRPAPAGRGYYTYKDLVWMEMEQNNPFLYKLILFLNPVWLNNAFGSVMTIFAAIISAVLLLSFEHLPGMLRLFIVAASFYSWARIFCFFILMAVLEKGTLLPFYFK